MNIQHFIKKINISRFLTCLLFLFLVVLGLKIFPDSGLGFDEPTNRRNGGISLNYVVQKYNNFFNTEIFKNDIELKKFNIPLDTYHDRDYGVAFDLPIFFIERVFEINNSKNQYLFRHISTYLIFLIGCFALFKTVKYRFSNEWLGILAVCFMVSSPRIFAESFYNIKDIVFMSFVSVTTYFFIRFVSKPNITNTIYFAIASAVSIDIRIVALIFPIAAILILLLQMCRFELSTKKGLLYITIYLLIMSLITVILYIFLFFNILINLLIKSIE